MIQRLGILCLLISLSACSYFTKNLNSAKTEDQIARCAQLKHDIIFNQATDDSLIAAQQLGVIDTINRDYRLNDCS